MNVSVKICLNRPPHPYNYLTASAPREPQHESTPPEIPIQRSFSENDTGIRSDFNAGDVRCIRLGYTYNPDLPLYEDNNTR
jgi:hypothetical protein